MITGQDFIQFIAKRLPRDSRYCHGPSYAHLRHRYRSSIVRTACGLFAKQPAILLAFDHEMNAKEAVQVYRRILAALRKTGRIVTDCNTSDVIAMPDHQLITNYRQNKILVTTAKPAFGKVRYTRSLLDKIQRLFRN